MTTQSTTGLVELKALAAEATPGPWPWEYTGDGKRIVVGEGLVEGPNGYEVAEVYSDDCPQEVAEANAKFIASAHTMIDLLSTQDTTIAELQGGLQAKEDGLQARDARIAKLDTTIAELVAALEGAMRSLEWWRRCEPASFGNTEKLRMETAQTALTKARSAP